MLKRCLLPLCVLVLGLLGGCGKGDDGTHGKIVEEMIAVMNDYADIMDTVKDEATAKAAAPKIDALATRAADVRKRMEDAGDPSKSVDDNLKTKYDAPMKAAMARIDASNTRMRNSPQLVAPMSEAMMKFGLAMMGSSK